MKGKSNSNGRRLQNILRTLNLHNIIQNATRITETTKTLLDLIIVNDRSKVNDSGVIDASIADRKLVLKLRKAEAAYWQGQFNEITSTQDFWKTFRTVTNKNRNRRTGPIRSEQGESLLTTYRRQR